MGQVGVRLLRGLFAHDHSTVSQGGSSLYPSSLKRKVDNSLIELAGGLSGGGIIKLYGPSHASLPSLAEIIAGEKILRFDSNGCLYNTGTSPNAALEFQKASGTLLALKVTDINQIARFYLENDANYLDIQVDGTDADCIKFCESIYPLIFMKSKNIGFFLKPETGEKIIRIGNATTEPSALPTDSVHFYALDIAGSSVPHFELESGDKIKLYPQVGLTGKDESTVDSTYGAEEAAVIANNRTRIEELETKLQTIGLLF